MIPAFDSFDFFARLLALLVILVPVVVLVRRAPARSAVFCLAGLYLLFLVAPRLAVWHALFWLTIAIAQRMVAATGERRSGVWVLAVTIGAAVLPMLLWKVWPIEFTVRFNTWGHTLVSRPGTASGWTWPEALDFTAGVIAPIGVSFATFRAADLLVKSNLGIVDPLPPGRVLAFGLFPSLLVVGPIATYAELAPALAPEAGPGLGRARFVDGTSQILTGLVRVFVLAYLLDWSADLFGVFDANAPWRLLVGLIAFTWFFYVNFAGYSDIAIGTATLLGADVRPNFDRPYQQTNPSAFWNSWHISLTRMLRDDVYTPIVARRPHLQYLATTVTMILIALWHGVSWATLVFGVYHAASLVGHRMLQRRRPVAAATGFTVVRVLKSVAVFAWFGLSLPLLHLGLADAADFYRSLVGL